MSALHAAMIALVAVAACAGEAPHEDEFDGPPRCSSGIVRDPNESESPDMMPGRACNACHARANAASGEADAAIFGFAGTVYPSAHEPDDCAGAAGAQVIVSDSAGHTFTATAGATGNFLVVAALLPPLQAKVTFQGRERRMLLRQTSGDCNDCHTAGGRSGAPGRIVLP